MEPSRLLHPRLSTQLLSILTMFSFLASPSLASPSLELRWDGIDLVRTKLPTGAITFNLTGKGTVLEALPLGISLRMPWWTFLIGATISVILVCRSLFLERKPGKEPIFTNIARIIGLAISVTQSVAGIIHYTHNSYRRSFIQPVNGNAYFALLAAVLSMHLLPGTTVNKIIVPIGLANAAVGMATFVLLALPDIGTAPLYQFSSPYCTTIITAGLDCGSDYYGNPDFAGTAFYCANTTALQVSENPRLPAPPYNYVFASIVGMIFLLALIGLVRWYSHEWLEDGDDDDSSTGWIFFGFCFLGFVIGVGLTLWSIVTVAVESGTNLNNCLGICLGSLNSSTQYINTTFSPQSNCAVFAVSLPRSIESLSLALEADKSNLARLIYNF